MNEMTLFKVITTVDVEEIAKQLKSKLLMPQWYAGELDA